MDMLIQQIINGLSLGSVYALIAVGYSLVYSILLFSNFAHGGFLVIGGYICYFALRGAGMNIWIASFVALLGAGVSAVIVERLAYKPIRERTPVTLYMLIASMGMSIVIENIFVVTVGGRFRALPPVIPTQPVNFFGIDFVLRKGILYAKRDEEEKIFLSPGSYYINISPIIKGTWESGKTFIPFEGKYHPKQ